MRLSDSRDEKRPFAINGRFLTQPLTGVQRYAREIVTAIDEVLLEDRGAAAGIRMVMPPGTDNPLPLSRIEICRSQFGSGHAWDQAVLPFYAKSGVLSLGNTGPLFALNHILCIHDANTFILPESYSRSFGAIYRLLLPQLGKRARRVATVSKFSANMLVKYGIASEEKLFIAPNGHEHVERWDATLANLPLLTKLTRPYVLLLGSSARHKNVRIVLKQAQAFDEAGIDIVVVGGSSGVFAANDLQAKRPNIHYTGFVGDNELAALYEKAMCLAFPSRTEGFGIPPLESMAKGCPVLSSNAASLVEVGGDAVLYADPQDAASWRDAIIGLSRNRDLRAALIAKGRQRATQFSWKRSARLYLAEIAKLQSIPL